MEASAGCRHVLHVGDTRPCVDGEELRGAFVMVKMAGDLNKWLRLAKQLADGLQCLHSAGYVQGDFLAQNVFYEALDDMKCPSGLRVADFGLSVPIGADRHSYFAARLYKMRMRDSKYPWFGLPSTWRFKVDPSIDWCEYSFLMHEHFRMRMSAPCPARSQTIDLPTWTACIAERRSTYCGRRMSKGGRKLEIYGNRELEACQELVEVSSMSAVPEKEQLRLLWQAQFQKAQQHDSWGQILEAQDEYRKMASQVAAKQGLPFINSKEKDTMHRLSLCLSARAQSLATLHETVNSADMKALAPVFEVLFTGREP
ncbi:unnamed protein product, partial [Polarella glacialis]